MFTDIEPFMFFFRTDAQTEDGLDDIPEDERGHEDETTDHEHTLDLDEKLRPGRQARVERGDILGDFRVVEQAERERAPDPVDQVHGQRTDRVVELDLVEEDDGEDHEHAADEADDGAGSDGGEGAGRGDGDEPSQAARSGPWRDQASSGAARP